MADITNLLKGDCLELMKKIPDESIDLILCDLPYGTTYAKFDKIIPFEPLWEEYRRISKDGTPIVLTANQPFSSALVMSNPNEFRCEWIWNKTNASNFANAKKQPLKQHETILVFSKKASRYYPQMVEGKSNHGQGKSTSGFRETMLITKRGADDFSGMKYPKTILDFPKHSSQSKLHPTQKPVELMEYLIKSYSMENDIVLDNCIGSGTTAIASINTNRQWIGMEQDQKYYDIASRRIQDHQCS